MPRYRRFVTAPTGAFLQSLGVVGLVIVGCGNTTQIGSSGSDPQHAATVAIHSRNGTAHVEDFVVASDFDLSRASSAFQVRYGGLLRRSEFEGRSEVQRPERLRVLLQRPTRVWLVQVGSNAFVSKDGARYSPFDPQFIPFFSSGETDQILDGSNFTKDLGWVSMDGAQAVHYTGDLRSIREVIQELSPVGAKGAPALTDAITRTSSMIEMFVNTSGQPIQEHVSITADVDLKRVDPRNVGMSQQELGGELLIRYDGLVHLSAFGTNVEVTPPA